MFLGIHEKGQKDQTKRKVSKEYRVLDNARTHDFSNNPDQHFCQTTMKKKVDGQETKNMNNQGPEWSSSTVRTAVSAFCYVFSEIKYFKEKVQLSSIWLSSRAKG